MLWAGQLVQTDLYTHQAILHDLVTRQDSDVDKATIAFLLDHSGLMRPSVTSDQMLDFMNAVTEKTATAVSNCNLKKSMRGGQYLTLQESTWETSELLIEACQAASIDPGELYRGHNYGIALHDDGQIFTIQLGYNKGNKHLPYPGCPDPFYQVTDVKAIEFDAELNQVEHGRMMALALPEGCAIDSAPNIPTGFFKTNTRILKEAAYLCVRENTPNEFQACAPNDLLNANVIDSARLAAMDQHYQNLTPGKPTDRLIDHGKVPFGFPGHAVKQTDDPEGVYRLISGPFKTYVTKQPIQFGGGYANARFDAGQILCLFGEDDSSPYMGPKNDKEENPNIIEFLTNGKLCIFTKPVLMQAYSGPKISF